MKRLLAVMVFLLVFTGYVFAAGLAKDDNNTSIQGAMAPTVAQKVTVSGTSAVNSTNFTYNIVRVTCTTAVYYKLGTSATTAAATDHFMGSGAVEYFNVAGYTRIAFLQVTAGGTCYISEMR